MFYKTYEPSEVLNPFIKCFWELESPREDIPEKQRIVPDGCMEMIFHYGDLYRQYLNADTSIIQPRCFVFGQITSELEIEPTGKTGIFAARFLPDGFTPFATMPVKKMENKAVALEQLFGPESKKLENKVLKVDETTEKIQAVETFLINRLKKPELIDRVVKSAVETIFEISGQLSVGELSQQINVNRRQLERKFSSIIGLSPKQLAKIMRLQNTLKMLLNKQFTSLTALAHEGHYYDQAHFIKDFKELTGVSPKEFYADNLKMSSLFYGTE